MTSVEIFVCIVAAVLGYLAVSHFLEKRPPPQDPPGRADNGPEKP